MRKDNIIHFAWYAAPYGGSFIRQILTLEGELFKNGYNLILVLPDDAKKQKWCQDLIGTQKMNIKFITEKNDRKKRIKEIEKIIEETKPAIIHSHFGMIENELLWISKRKSIPFVYHSRAAIAKSKNLLDKIKKYIKYSILYKGVYIIGLNGDMKCQLEKYKFNMKFYKEIPEVLDFSRLRAETDFSRNDLKLSEKDNITLMMGYDMEIKGVDIALKAFELIKEKNYKLLVVMAKDKENNLNKIKEICKGRIPKYLTILNPTENIADYYKISDQFLSASRTEGFSNSVLEALYLKKKVIISDIEGVSWAKKYESVFSYDVNDYVQLKECIINKKKIKEEKLEEIQNKIKDKYSMETWIRDVMNLYKKIIYGEE